MSKSSRKYSFLFTLFAALILFGCASQSDKDDIKLQESDDAVYKSDDVAAQDAAKASPSAEAPSKEAIPVDADKSTSPSTNEKVSEAESLTPPPPPPPVESAPHDFPPPDSGLEKETPRKHAKAEGKTRKITLKRNCNVRSKPSTSAHVIKKLDKGARLTVKSFNKLWYKTKSGYLAKKCAP